MWLFTRYGFFSVSILEGKTVVRGRRKAHLKDLVKHCPSLEGARIITTLKRDYPFRIVVERQQWEAAILLLTNEQTWDNFKSEVLRYQGWTKYEELLHKVWSLMRGLEDSQEWGKARFALPYGSTPKPVDPVVPAPDPTQLTEQELQLFEDSTKKLEDFRQGQSKRARAAFRIGKYGRK
jgi:hypothetical protein